LLAVKLKKFLIAIKGVTHAISTIALEIHVVRMDIKQSHAAVFRNPIDFAFPDFDRVAFQEGEDGGVLGERVGELDVARPRSGGSWEMGDRRWEFGLGDGRWEMGDGRRRQARGQGSEVGGL